MPPKKASATGSAAGSQRPDPETDSIHEDDTLTPPDPSATVEALRAQLTAANARLAAAENPVPARRDPKIPSPPEFSGKVSEFRNFMAQCTLTLHMCPNTYVTDEQKVLFIVSLLRGPALTWARDIPEQPDHQLRNDYPAFKTALSNLYLDRNLKAACEDKLSRLRQTKSAAAYAVEFQTTVAPLGLNNDAECLFFYLGLKSEIKDDLATVGRATTLSGLIDQAIGIDQRKHQRRLEEKKVNPSSSSSSSSSSSGPHDSKPKSQSNFASANQASQSNSPQFSRPRGPLTDAEKARRKQKGLCVYCADPAHAWDNCPRRLANAAKANPLPVVPPYSQHLTPTAGSIVTIQSGKGNPQAPTRSEA